ncbi:MAG: hypothetical protein C0434_07165 [Xanthomonadaceae bacterium]|nr:hypothetical protein [Xanthomonadaceae bacterium]
MRKAAYLAIFWSLGAATAIAAETPPAPAAADATAKPAETRAPRTLASYWAYQPVKAPALPAVKNARAINTPIDAFVQAKLETMNLGLSAAADRAIFIRRATLDVWGVIPTPEEVRTFADDKSPDAYEKLVDRLLASPRYGERQARRWLDLARYADSSGFQNDTTRPNMFRYRDYVIDAFNQDKPFDRFILEQLAGDEIAPNDPQALIATGFLAGYPDNSNSRDLVQRKYQITTDITDTVGEVFLAQTVACARCHDHKFDRISQKEYFQLQAFFANTSEVVDVAAPLGEQEKQFQKATEAYEAVTRELRDKRKAVIAPVLAEAIKYQKERYLTDSRESVFKPKEQWTALDRWINHRWANVTRDDDFAAYLKETGENPEAPGYIAANGPRYVEYKRLSDELKKFDKLKPVSGSDKITAMSELGRPDAPPTFVYFGGDHERPLQEVKPDFPAAIANGQKPEIVPTATSSGRRTALAKWIASPQNPLTARVFVNRVWNQYFGNGVVRTVSDFGKAGERPINPELLDYLADSFVREGWSVKKLHRQILLSGVYRQRSEYRPEVAKLDPDNKLLAVFPRRRLDAEQIRDSLLVAAGKLEEQIGGPSVFAPIPKDLNAGPLWPVSKDEKDHHRRSLYIFTRRSVAYPLLESFDMASAQQVHSKREVTTTPLQALTLVNSDLVFDWSQQLAGRVIREAGSSQTAQLDRLYEILFARKPDVGEKATLAAFLDSHQKVIREKASDGKFSIAVPAGIKGDQVKDPIRASAFVDLVHMVANSNDFSYRF